jgi:hypothetical protein
MMADPKAFTQEVVDQALNQAFENGHMLVSTPARTVAIDMMTYNIDFETEADEDAIAVLVPLVEDWQARRRKAFEERFCAISMRDNPPKRLYALLTLTGIDAVVETPDAAARLTLDGERVATYMLDEPVSPREFAKVVDVVDREIARMIDARDYSDAAVARVARAAVEALGRKITESGIAEPK